MAQATKTSTTTNRRPWRKWLAPDQGWTAQTLRHVFLAIGLAVTPSSWAWGQEGTFQLPPGSAGASTGGAAPQHVFPSSVPITPMPARQAPAYGPTNHDTTQRSDRFGATSTEPENLDLETGRPRLLRLPEPFTRLQVADPNIVDCKALDSHRRELSLRGLQPGTTLVNFFFGDPSNPDRQELKSYLVRVAGRDGSGERVNQAHYEDYGVPPATSYAQPPRRTAPGPDLASEEPQVIEVQVPHPPGYTGTAPRPLNQVPSQPLPHLATDHNASGGGQSGYQASAPGTHETRASLVQSTGAQPPAQKGPPLKDVTEEPPSALAMPRRLEQNPCLEGAGARPGSLATPSAETVQRYKQFVESVIVPEVALEIVQGRTVVLKFSDPPFRIGVGDDKILASTPVGDVPRQLILQGLAPGGTTLNIWFGDAADPAKQTTLSYQVSVLPEPGARARLERVYKQLQDEVNQAFPDAYVRLFLVGDKLAVCGQVKDSVEAVHILQVIRSQAPANPTDRAAVSRNPAANIPLNLGGLPLDPLGRGATTLEDYIVQGESNIINLLRVAGEQQVALKIVVAEVSRAAERNMGINFSIANAAGQTVFTQATGGLISGSATTATTGSSNIANLTGLIDGGRVSLLIQALRNVNLARSLAEQSLVTMNGHPANFLAGGEFPVPVTTTSGITSGTGTQFVPFGVQLSFTPYITDKDRIRLTLNATVSTRDVATGANIGGSAVPGLDARTISTTVELREGQTLAIGGLMQTNFGGNTSRVPLFGDIPFGGQFFRNDQTSASESELVLLVTPQLVHPLEPNEIPPLPGSDMFEPNDIGFYLHGKLENTRSYDYRSPVMHDIARMRAYRDCNIMYMVGPTGYTDGH